tara:strand:+ start:8436 stop:9263 length:828 start_codon:yes stop_codon:yes gene_type:complete
MISGYIKVHRRLLESEVFEDPRLFKTWMWILCKANFKPVVLNNGKALNTGQFAMSYGRAARHLDCSVNTVRRHFKRLKAMQMIDTQSGAQFTVVSVCNYRTYQHSDGNGGAPTDTQTDTHTDTQTDTETAHRIRNIRKQKNNNKGIGFFTGMEPARQAQLEKWYQYRQQMGGYTQQQLEEFAKTVQHLDSKQLELKVSRAIANGWKSLVHMDVEPVPKAAPAKRTTEADVMAGEIYSIEQKISKLQKHGDPETIAGLRSKLKELKSAQSKIHQTG